jgi:hypothetical protein
MSLGVHAMDTRICKTLQDVNILLRNLMVVTYQLKATSLCLARFVVLDFPCIVAQYFWAEDILRFAMGYDKNFL